MKIQSHKFQRFVLQSRKNVLFLLAIIVLGAAVGALLASFLWALNRVTDLRSQHLWLIALLPFVAVATAFTYRKIGAGAEHGNNLVIQDVHGKGEIRGRMVALTYIFSLLTHLTGGSAGREGAGVAIGAALFTKVAKVFRIKHLDRRLFTMAGISAGFSAIFGTPFAGAFFGLEMAFVGKVSYEALVPCFVASYVASLITRWLKVAHETPVIQVPLHVDSKLVFVAVVSALCFGLIARGFVVGIRGVKKLYAKLLPHYLWRAVVSGTLVALILLLFNLERYAGLSTWLVDAGFAGQTTFFDPVMKFVLTILTLAVGLQGGEVTPLFGIGAAFGGALGVLTGTDVSLLAGLGMIGIFGAAANAPLTTIALGVELFGARGLPYYVFVALAGYFIMGNESLYPSQIIATAKSHSLRYQRRHSVEETHIH